MNTGLWSKSELVIFFVGALISIVLSLALLGASVWVIVWVLRSMAVL